MTDAAKKARADYYRQWARDNPDKVKAAQDRYWARKAAETKSKEPAKK